MSGPVPAPIVPPATIGMIGGGQLGRYAIMAAKTLGYQTIVLEPDPHAPAAAVVDRHLVAAYDDPAALDELGRACAVVTIEFENAPAGALETLQERTIVAPSPSAVAVAQDRSVEKRFLEEAGFAVAPYAVIEEGSLTSAFEFPAILKTARLGYDGHGQRRLTAADELDAALKLLGSVPCVLEQLLPLDAELSVIVARNVMGEVVSYPAAQNHHVDGILDVTIVPAAIDGALTDRAGQLAMAIADALGYVGVLAVEFFVVDGELVVNELAPRPHNSGHWTLDAAQTSQFELQIRAVCGLGLGDTSMVRPAAAMVNLLGDVWDGGQPTWASVFEDSRCALHLYGKSEARPGRKMGHLTGWGDDVAEVRDRLVRAREELRRPR